MHGFKGILTLEIDMRDGLWFQIIDLKEAVKAFGDDVTVIVTVNSGNRKATATVTRNSDFSAVYYGLMKDLDLQSNAAS